MLGLLAKWDLAAAKTNGRDHLGLIPKFCCFFEWKASLRAEEGNYMQNYQANLSLPHGHT